MNYPTSPTKENSSISKLALEYYKKFGRNRDLQQYFVLSTPLTLSQEQIESDDTTIKPEIKFNFRVDENRPKYTDRDLDSSFKVPDIVVGDVETGRLSSASSVLSDKRLEWDSGADVGYSNFYNNRAKERSFSLPSLSTIESIDYTKQFIGSDSRINDKMHNVNKIPNAESTPKNQVQQFFKDAEVDVTPILKNKSESVESTLVEQSNNLRVSFQNLKQKIIEVRKKSVSLEDTRTVERVPVPATSVSQPNISESAQKSPFIENLFIYSPTVLKFLRDTQSNQTSGDKVTHSFDKEIQTTLDRKTPNENQKLQQEKSEMYYSANSDPKIFDTNIPERNHRPNIKKHNTSVPKSNSFEYIPETSMGKISSGVTFKNDDEKLTSTGTETTNTDSERSIGDILMQAQYSTNLTEDLEKTASALKSIIETKNYTAKDKKRLIKRIVKKIVSTSYDEDSPENIYEEDLTKNVPWTPAPLERPEVSTPSSFETNATNLVTLMPHQGIDDFDKNTFMVHVPEKPVQIEPQLTEDSKSVTEDDSQGQLNWKNNITLSEKIFHQRLKYLHNQREALNKKVKRRKKRTIHSQNFKDSLMDHAFQEGEIAGAIDPTVNKKFLEFTEKEREEHLKWIQTEMYHLSQLKLLLETKSLPATLSTIESAQTNARDSSSKESTFQMEKTKISDIPEKEKSKISDISKKEKAKITDTPEKEIKHTCSSRILSLDLPSASHPPTESGHTHSCSFNPNLEKEILSNIQNFRFKYITCDCTPQTPTEGPKKLDQEIQVDSNVDKSKEVSEDKISDTSSKSISKSKSADNSTEIQIVKSFDKREYKSSEDILCPKDDATQTSENLPRKMSKSTSYSLRSNSSSNSERESLKSTKSKIMCPHVLEKKIGEFQRYLEEIKNNKVVICCCENTSKESQEPKESSRSVSQSTSSSHPKKDISNKTSVSISAKSGTSLEKPSTIIETKENSKPPILDPKNYTWPLENSLKQSSRELHLQELKKKYESSSNRKNEPQRFTVPAHNEHLREHFDYSVSFGQKSTDSKSAPGSSRTDMKDCAVQCSEPCLSVDGEIAFGVRSVDEPSPNTQKPVVLPPTSVSSRSSTNFEFRFSPPEHFDVQNNIEKLQTQPEASHLRAGQSNSPLDTKTCKCCSHRKNDDLNNLRKKVQEMLNRCEKCHKQLEKIEKPAEFPRKCQCRCKSPNVELKFIDPRNLTEKAKKDIQNICCCRDYTPLCRNCQHEHKVSRQNFAYFLRLETRDDLVIEQSSSSERSPPIEVQIHVPKFKKKGERIVPNDEIQFIQYTNLEKKKLPTLKEFLLMNNPNFVQAADSRRQYLLDVESERKIKTNLLKNDLNKINNDLERKLNEVLRSKKYRKMNNRKRLFSTKSMKEMTRLHYRKCVETYQKKNDIQNQRQARTNRLMKELFSKKLEQYVHEGKLNFSFSKTVL